MSGALPNIRIPTRNTLAAIQSAAKAPTAPIPIDNQTCHAGGGSADARRSSMPNELIGGAKLTTTASVELGFWLIGHHSIHGTNIASISGIISCCASRISLAAEP